MINTAIIIVSIICATVVIIFVIGCIHDYLKATQDARNMERFEKAFKDFKEYEATRNDIRDGAIVNSPNLPGNGTQETTATDYAEMLDFPNSRADELKDKYK